MKIFSSYAAHVQYKIFYACIDCVCHILHYAACRTNNDLQQNHKKRDLSFRQPLSSTHIMLLFLLVLFFLFF